MTQAAPISSRRLGAGAAAGVDEALIGRLVPAFYAKVRRDPLLGPVFNGEVDDWDHHLVRLCDFWSSVLLMTGRYKGQPVEVHAKLEGVGAPHFVRWLQLFHEAADEVCPPDAAALFKAKADIIGESLQLGIAFRRGEPPPPLRKRG